MKHKFLIFVFVAVVLAISMAPYGNSERCIWPTIIKGQVFLNGNPLNEGIMKIYVNNSYDGETNISRVYFYVLNNISSNQLSKVTLKIYVNNTLLKESVFFISCGDDREYPVFIFSAATSDSSGNLSTSRTTNETSSGTNATSDMQITPSPEYDSGITSRANITNNRTTNNNETTHTQDTKPNITNQPSQPPTPPQTPPQSNASNQNISNQDENQLTPQIDTVASQDNETNRTIINNRSHADFMPLFVIPILILLLVLIFLIVKRKVKTPFFK